VLGSRVTFSELKAAVSAYVTADDDTQLGRWINQSVTDILLRTKAKVMSATMTTTANVSDYTLSTDILRMTYLKGSDGRILERVSEEEIHDRRHGTSTGTAMRYALGGGNLLMLYPTPTSAETLTVYYCPRPATLSGASDTPSEIPAEFHDVVVWGALSRAADYDDDLGTGQGAGYTAQYEQGILRIKQYLSKKGGTRLPRASVGTRRNIPPARHYDIIW
jgi:hypothetical protein